MRKKHIIKSGLNELSLQGEIRSHHVQGAPPFVYEGEITNTKVAQNLPGFDTTFLWTSTHTLHPWSFNRAINKGAGFVSYSGHGFEHGWGTYRPNSLTKTRD